MAGAVGRVLLVVVVLLAGCSNGGGESGPGSGEHVVGARLQQALEEVLRDEDIPGASVALELGDGSQWAGVAGVADRHTGDRVTSGTPFRLASVTKTYTAALALRLVADGRLELDEPVLLDGLAAGTTLRHLLSHTSGLPHEYEGAGPWTEQAFADLDVAPVCTPGSCVEYSDLGFIAVGLLLERSAGEPFEELVRGLMGDVGLDHSWFSGSGELPDDTAKTYDDVGDLQGDGFEERFGPRTWSAGAMVATADDVLRWGLALLGGKMLGGTERTEMVDLEPTLGLPCLDACAGPYGLGLEGGRITSRATLGHQGSTGAFLAHLPEEGITAAVLTNRAGAGRAVLERLIGALGIEERADVYVMAVDGTGLRRLTDEVAVDGGPAWSPDGAHIVFGSTRDGQSELYAMNADGSDERRLTDDPADDVAGRYSADGERIVFASNRTGSFDIWTMAADGSEERPLTDDAADERLASFAPDGRIAFEVGPDGDRDIAVMAGDGSARVVLTQPGDQWHASWSPDGERIAFAEPGAGISTMRPDGAGVSHVPGSLPGDRFPVWGTGGEIAFNNGGDIWAIGPDGSSRRRLLLSLEEEFTAWWSPDATHLVLSSDCVSCG